jgi:outer membrane protein assembly factor BamB
MTFADPAGKGTVYAAGRDGLYAVRAIDGKQLWHMELQFLYGYGQFQQGVVVEGGIIYGVESNGEVCAVNAANGNKIWSFPTRHQPSGIAVANGVVYVGGVAEGSGVYAVRDGKEVWHAPFPTPGPNAFFTASGPLVAGNLVYVCTYTNTRANLHAFRIASGVDEWRHETSNDVNLRMVSNGTVYLNRVGNGMVYALNADNGQNLWQFKGSVSNGPAVTADGDTVYVAGDQAVYALHARSGKEIWRFATHNQALAVASGVTPAGDTVYVTDNNLHALRAIDGKERWSFSAEVSSPLLGGELVPNTSLISGVIAAKDIVYFAGADHRVYALHT